MFCLVGQVIVIPSDLLPTICLPWEDWKGVGKNLFGASERIIAPVYSAFVETVCSARLVNLEFPISASYTSTH